MTFLPRALPLLVLVSGAVVLADGTKGRPDTLEGTKPLTMNGDIPGEALLRTPVKGKAVADVVALPDADVTPEQLVGLTPGVLPAAQYARRLAESGCRVLVPVLIDRTYEARNGRAKMTSREFLYRSAFELGRHLIGYEVQKVLAGVDWFASGGGKKAKVGVLGVGEGGMLALYAAALDTR